jgi:RNA polymerase sigma factor (TIGR02999 family)
MRLVPEKDSDAAPLNQALPLHSNGRQQLDDVVSAAYEQLRRLAKSIKRNKTAATASPTSLVHAAWLKLAQSLKLPPQSELHCKHLVAQAMRQLVVEASRRRHAQKRGGVIQFIRFDDNLGVPLSSSRELLALNDAWEELSQVSPRQAEMIVCQSFGGMSVADMAKHFNVAPRTVNRECAAAKAWLAYKIRRKG